MMTQLFLRSGAESKPDLIMLFLYLYLFCNCLLWSISFSFYCYRCCVLPFVSFYFVHSLSRCFTLIIDSHVVIGFFPIFVWSIAEPNIPRCVYVHSTLSYQSYKFRYLYSRSQLSLSPSLRHNWFHQNFKFVYVNPHTPRINSLYEFYRLQRLS